MNVNGSKQQLESKHGRIYRKLWYVFPVIFGLLFAGAINLAPVQAQALPFCTPEQELAEDPVVIGITCLVSPPSPLNVLSVPHVLLCHR